MITICETSQLIVRQLTLADAPFLVKLLNTPGWLKFIGDRHVYNEVHAQQYMTNGALKSYRELGFGLWLVQLKDGTSVGLCGFLKRDYLPFPDLGFAFLPEFSGKGLAFEAAQALLVYATQKLHFEKIMAITMPANQASISLLGKLGFTYEDTIAPPGSTDVLNLFSLNGTNYAER